MAKPVWPGSGQARVQVTSDAFAQAGKLPIWVAAGGAASPRKEFEGKAGVSGIKSAPAAKEAKPADVAAPPSQVQVDELDAARVKTLGGVGIAFQLRRVDGGSEPGPVQVAVDYSGFAQAFGANFADRLRLVRLPGCSLARPDDPACSAVPVTMPATNNPATGKLTAQLTAAPPAGTTPDTSAAAGDGSAPVDSDAVFVLASTAAGSSTGDYRATDMRPSGSWSVGLSSGSYNYSYSIPTPPSVGGSAPDLSFGYDSGSVDGYTNATNTQASWTGLGWDLSPGFIERKYRGCAEDVDSGQSDQVSWGDSCWESPYANDGEDNDNATTRGLATLQISLGGHTSQLIRESSGVYRLEDDPGWRVEHKSGGPNDDQDGEYWVVYTPDGTQYRFGYGQDGGGTATHSNWTVPVVGDDADEPCHGDYPASCRQTWRWNLDRVVDRNENSTYLYWENETNYYKRYASSNLLSYDRGGYLSQVVYGTNSSVAGDHVAAKVVFNTVNRCTERIDGTATTCPTIASSSSSYPDVPTDLICSSSSCSNYSPSFFATKRLDSVETFFWDASSSAWVNDTLLKLSYKMPNPTGLTASVLWLDKITEVGEAGDDADAITLPPVNFDSVFLTGRVDYDESAGVPKMYLPRIATVFNGMGGQTNVSYGRQAPCPAPSDSGYSSWLNSKNGHWDTNTDDCYPVPYTPEDASPGIGIFHKYLVTKVDDVDNVGGTTTHRTVYEYDLSSGAWAHNRDYEAPQNSWTWNEWRGYGAVRVTEGASATPTSKSVSTTTFFRGMNDDVLADGTHKTATRTDFDGNVWDDDRQLAGDTLQVRNWKMTADASDPDDRTFVELNSQRNQFTSVHAVDGPGARNAQLVRQSKQHSRTRLDDGTFRETDTRTTYDGTYGLPLVEADAGQLGVADNTCTQITYNQNTDTSGGHFLLDFPETTHTNVGDPDDATGNCLGTLLSQTVTLYDGKTSTSDTGHPIADGNPTQVDSSIDATHVSSVKNTYDSYGRLKSQTDPRNKTTTTVYNPAVGFPVNGVIVTNPLGHTATTYPSRFDGEANKATDANNLTVTFERDPLRRLTKVWLPTEPTSGDPSYSFSYFPSNSTSGAQPTAPPKVTSQQLQSGSGDSAVKLSSYAYLDGFGHTREVQTPSPAGGRIIVSTKYDSRGLVSGTSEPIYDTANAGSGLFNPVNASIPIFHQINYDPLKRQTEDIAMHTGAEQWRTTATYHGDHTETTPPAGGKTFDYVDVHGNLTKVAEYDSDGTTPHDTTYTYDRLNRLTGITDAHGDVSSYTYDLLGRRRTSDDPDHGYSTTDYDLAGNPTVTVDAKGQKITSVYDDLGRLTQQWSGDADTGTKLAEWAYDTVAKGQLTSSSAYNQGHAYTSTVTGYDDRTRPTGKTVTIPSAEGVLGGDYSYTYTYDGADHLTSITYPEAGGLPAETVTSTYTDLGLFSKLTSDYSDGYTYLKTSSYTDIAQPSERDLGPAGGVARSYTYDPATNRLSNLHLKVGADTATPTTVQDDDYSYDKAGDITRVADNTTQVGGVTTPQSQCFTYDARRRLSDAWTTTAANCQGGAAAADNNGPDPYKLGYHYDALGNITSATSGISPQVTTSYTYPSADTAADQTPGHPNAVSTVGSDNYGYDANGALTSRTVSGVTSTLNWDPLQRLSSLTSGGQSTSFVYDAGGDRIIRREPTSTTAYLDGMELRAAGNTVTATRYYTADTDVIALRKAGDDTPTWLAADTQDSTQIAVDGSTGATDRQRYLPFGAHRGGDTITATDRGYLGHTEDATTGLDQLGARYYDPTIGRFISTDPVQNLADPQQRNPYAYAADNPMTLSDPSGLQADCPSGAGGCGNTGNMGGGNGKGDPDYSPTGDNCVAYGTCKGAALQRLKRNEERRRQAVACAERGGITCPTGTGPEGDAATVEDGLDLYGAGHWGFKKFGFKEQVTSMLKTGLFALTTTYGGPEELAEYAGIRGLAKLIGWAAKSAKTASRGRKAARLGEKIGCAAGNSFTPDTEVLLANGKHKPISKIKLGDKVLATDPTTGKTKPEPVVALIAGHGIKQLTTITIDTDGDKGHQTATVTATDQHPLWATANPARTSLGHWTDATDLHVGAHLRTPDGHTVEIIAVRHYSQSQAVNNLTVASLHTYYVEAGTTPVLVHNCSNPGTGFDVPDGPGVYTIHLDDGKKYVGSSVDSMRTRVNKSMRSKHAVRKAGYGPDNVVNVTWVSLPDVTDSVVARRVEQTVMDGLKDQGVTLVNRRDPEIAVPFGGYLP
ncbi:RHS repeat-associated core domain-containing protein [Actinoallomurus iriomotensis]|uniref:RHS repeat-associated core domain-containing protein n=1 Tax=Actinoallomurus iriomotensis TaxID=478107 RepID=UPI002555D53E|nr:RHS repeat-associated core domain-containing protein [Actinoallomurus iriomotensis]